MYAKIKKNYSNIIIFEFYFTMDNIHSSFKL